MITAAPAREYFRTDKLAGLPATARVDHATRTIYGAKALEVGPLNDGDSRNWKVDETSLVQLQELATAKNGGAKMRFAHPNMSRDGMGRHIGRAMNARIVRENGPAYVAVDAVLNAKGGQRTSDMVSHVLDLADNAPEDFGLSIAPILDHEAMGRIEPDKDGRVSIRLKALNAIDFVDEPAATRGGLFDLHSDEVQDLPAQVTNILDTFFATAPAEVIRQRFGEFLDRYLNNRSHDMADQLTATLGVEEDVTKLQAEVEALKAEIAAMKGEGDPPAKEPAAEPAAEGDMAAKAAREKLSRVAEISALAKLAKVDDATKQLMLDAGFSRAEAQDWLKSCGHLSTINPPVPESDDTAAKKESPEEVFGREWDAHQDVFTRQGVSRELYVKSRIKDAK